MPAPILWRAASVDRRLSAHPWPATPTSTTRSSSCPPTSAAPSSRSGTSAAPWTMRWTRRRARERRRSAPARERIALVAAASWRAASTAARRESGRAARSCRSIAQFNLPRAPFEALIEGVEMDLGNRRYETFADLYEYCIRVASAVGLDLPGDLRLRATPRREQYAIDLGVALQLTNILRDVPGDLAQGRVYLPLEDLRAHGCTEADLRAEMAARRRRRAFAGGQGAAAPAGGARARLLRAARRGRCRGANARRLVAAEIMGAIYRALLRRIERADYDVFSRVVRVPRPRRAVIAAATWAQDRAAPVTSARRHRRRRRLRRAERGGALADARRARAGARCAAAARRPRDGVHRPRDRRARRQRPARAVRLLSRDARVPAPGRRGRSRSRAGRRSSWSATTASGGDRCCAARRCRRRCTCSPASSTGSRSRGAIGWRAAARPADPSGAAPAADVADGLRRAARATVQQWLDRHGQGPTLQEWLWDPLAVAALNQQPDDAAAAPFVRVLAEMFAPDPAAAALVLPLCPLHEMYAEPARDFIAAAAARCARRRWRACTSAAGVVAGVEVRGERLTAGAVDRGRAVVRAARRCSAPSPPRELQPVLDAAPAWRRCRS